MFLIPLPEDWNPAEHGWTPAPTKTPSDFTCFVRWAPPARFPASLTVFRSLTTGQLVAFYGRLETSGDEERVKPCVLLDEVGIKQSDFEPADERKTEITHD